ncbi:MAG: hypothetical protein ACLTYN_01720 [Dysosmobacter welbionis]
MPKYEFARQMRSDILSQPLKLGPDELAIFEGIHALNDVIVGKDLNLQAVYRGPVQCGGRGRRRGVPAPLAAPVPPDRPGLQVPGQRRQLHPEDVAQCPPGKSCISPYKENADLMFDSSLPDEVAVLKPFVVPLLEALPQGRSTRSRTTSSGDLSGSRSWRSPTSPPAPWCGSSSAAASIPAERGCPSAPIFLWRSYKP